MSSDAFSSLQIFPNETLLIILQMRIADTRDTRSERVRDMKALCLVSPIFRAVCQKEIFSHVALPCYDPTPKRNYIARKLATMPSLACYVRKLTLRITNRLENVARHLKKALAVMINVEEIILHNVSRKGRVTENPPELGHDDHPRAELWTGGFFADILQLPTLRSLTVRNFHMPESLFYTSGRLDVLNLINVELTSERRPPFWGVSTIDEKFLSVGTLRMRGSTFVFPTERRWTGFPFKYDTVEHMEVPITLQSPYGTCAMREASSLRKLHLRTTHLERAVADTRFLTHLNPASFATVTSLSFDIGRHLSFSRRDGYGRADPYLGIFGDLECIRKFVQLEEVVVRIYLSRESWCVRVGSDELDWPALPGTLGAEEEPIKQEPLPPSLKHCLGRRWDGLDRAFAPDSGLPFPHLKSVSLHVFFQKGTHTLADGFMGKDLSQDVFKSRLQGLRALKESGKISLCLKAKICEEKFVDW